MAAVSVNGSSYAGSVASSRSSASIRVRAEREQQDGQNEDLLERKSPLESGIFGVLFTLSKENSETRIRIRWVLLKILLDAWQLFTTVISPAKQGWSINADGTAWAIVGVLNFTWLQDLGYSAYLAVLYAMVALLAFNIALCVWVAWCFKEHKFPVVWPIKVLRVFSSVFFQAFDVASLNLLQLGISCRYTGPSPHLVFNLFPDYSCTATPHIMHAVVSAICLVLFVTIALLLNMAEVEVNPLSRRPLALGHSGAEVMSFAIKVLLTLVDVFIGWQRVAACVYLALSLALAWQGLRWSPNLVAWVNYLKGGVAICIVWCASALMLLVFRPGFKEEDEDKWADIMTTAMLVGLAPAFALGAFMSRFLIRRMTNIALNALASAKADVRLEDICDNLDDPRDVEIVARCCRVWKDRYTLDPDAVDKGHQVIKAGLAMFPGNAYMVLLHGNFMIDVLGVSQSGGSRIEDARKLNPSLVCRFIMFVRQQQATQKAAGSGAPDGAHMDLLGYVEYQRKQRMVVRLHREALQAMCNFWKALDASRVSFMHLSKALGKIESSVSQAQSAYRVVLENYGHNPKLVRLYGKFLQTIKNDPWRASEYFAEADRLEEVKNGDARGPLLPDGTPLGRMDEMATAVLVINATGEVQMANRHTHLLFGYKRGTLEGKPLATLLAPHMVRKIADRLSELSSSSGLALSAGAEEQKTSHDEVMVGMHYDRLAFPIKLSLRKVSGVGEDSTFIALLEPVPPISGVASLWVAPNGTVAACDPQFVSNFGWKAAEVNGSNIMSFMSVSFSRNQASRDEEMGPTPVGYGESASDAVSRLFSQAKASADNGAAIQGLKCVVAHKYENAPMACTVIVAENGGTDMPVHEVRVKLEILPSQVLVANRKGNIVHVSAELVGCLKDVARAGQTGPKFNNPNAMGGPRFPVGSGGGGGMGNPGAPGISAPGADELAGYTLSDFLPSPWKEMHVKLLKDTTTMTPLSRTTMRCRTPTMPGPTLELRSASGKSVLMNVSVTTMDIAGELNHVVRLARSNQESALAERRLRLSLTADGLVSSLSEGAARQLFGLEPSQVIGRGVWEIVEEPSVMTDGGRLSTPGPPRMVALVSRSLTFPGRSWRVQVCPPQMANKGGVMDLAGAARSALAKPAVMLIHVEPPSEGDDAEKVPGVFVDLWPLTSVTGVLEMESTGRIRSVLEECTRPVGLLFGLPNQSLVGSMLSQIVAMPAGRSLPGDLLSLHAAKKSSLKTNKKESHVKVGPVHMLHGVHTDSRPVHLDVQIVGKPGPKQTVWAILRFHAAPMVPGASGTATGYTAAPPVGITAAPSFNQAALMKAITGGDSGASQGPSARIILPQTSKQASARFAAVEDVTGSKRWDDDEDDDGLESASAPRPKGSPRMKGSPRPTGLSSAAGGDAAATNTVASPSHVLAGMGDGLQVGGVIVGRAAQLVGRSKLADMVKSAGGGSARKLSGGDEKLQVRSNSRFDAGKAVVDPMDERQSSGQPSLPGAAAGADLLGDLGDLIESAKKGSALAADVQSVGGESDDHNSDKETRALMNGNGRISTWVASKGAFYQNSVGANFQSDEDRSRRSGDGSDGGGADMIATVRVDTFVKTDMEKKGAMSPGPRSDYVGGYQDDDAASEGGQSAMSAQSANGGAEYKRGKRFRKLIKLMDSSQAQQVQQRFRTHALATVAILAIVHVVCFTLIVTAIASQKTSMLNLGHNGEVQRYMQQILIDVRSLDVISKDKTFPNLYTAANASFFVDRISTNAEIVKTRLNDILGGHHSEHSPVLKLFYYTNRMVWNGNDEAGADMMTNLTVWDFATRFYTMSTNIVQHYDEWVRDGVFVADTVPGQFVLKSGPDLFKDSRKILDALLFEAADNVHWVDTLQLIFLAVEGTAISSMAAFYLAYLLRSVAAQRHKLYGTFLVIPLGLTRALASQNTTLLVDDDDEDDEDDDEERQTAPVLDEDEEGDPVAKVKRRATLNVSEASSPNAAAGNDGNGGNRRSLGRSMSATGRILDGQGNPADQKSYDKLRTVTAESLDGRSAGHHNRSFGWTSLWRKMTGRNGVAPGPAAPISKRKLKDDSHETIIMMVPFVFWSAVVITIYSIAVVHMKGVVEVVAIHSVSNFMSARTFRTVHYCQEVAVVEDPSQLATRRADLLVVMKLVRDAWYTLQLGKNAYLAAGADTERFPLVNGGLAYASPALADKFYGTGSCHRTQENLPCVGPENRFYQVTHTGLDSMMQQFMMSIAAIGTNTSMVPEGLGDEHFDFVYNVGAKDLLDGTISVEMAHYDTILELFQSILTLHVILFLILWVVFAGFLILLLNPLLKRISKERRRIAELMSQLPLELDVERLVARALGTMPNPGAVAPPGAPTASGLAGGLPGRVANVENTADGGGEEFNGNADATNKWKAIIRSASSGLNSNSKMQRPSFSQQHASPTAK